MLGHIFFDPDKEMIQWLIDDIIKDRMVFDIGCGSGEVLFRLSEAGHTKLIGVDPFTDHMDFMKERMKRTDAGYFANALAVEKYVYSGKATAKNVRRYLREELKYDLPWYKHLETQKELRELIKELETCDSQDYAIQIIGNLHSNVYYWDMDRYEERELSKLLEDHFACEPWNFLETEPSPQYKFLVKLHKELIKQL